MLNPNINILALVNILLASILLAVIMLKSKTILAPIGFHTGLNVSQELLGIPVSGVRSKYFIVKTIVCRYDAITGYDFGLESSILFTFIMIIMLTIELYRFKCQSESSSSLIRGCPLHHPVRA